MSRTTIPSLDEIRGTLFRESVRAGADPSGAKVTAAHHAPRVRARCRLTGVGALEILTPGADARPYAAPDDVDLLDHVAAVECAVTPPAPATSRTTTTTRSDT